MSGRESERLRLEMVGLHRFRGSGEQSANQSTSTGPRRHRQNVGKMNRNDSAPISFVRGEKVKYNAAKTEVCDLKGLSVAVEEPSGGEAPSNASKLNDLEWVANSNKSGVLLRMMKNMGFKEGQGLGKTGQGIVEPIHSKPNPGTKVFGASHEGRKWGSHRVGEGQPGTSQNPQNNKDNVINSLKSGGYTEQSAEAIWQAIGVLANHQIMSIVMGLGLAKNKGNRFRCARRGGTVRKYWGQTTQDGAVREAESCGEGHPEPSPKGQDYKVNVIDSLKSVGYTEQSAEAIWQAMGVLANHQIMSLGMGVGLVKKRVGRSRMEMKKE